MKSPHHSLCITFCCLMANQVFALDNTYTPKPKTYQEVKTAYEQLMAGKPSKAQRLEFMRATVRESRLGGVRADWFFHNFEGIYSLDPTKPGVEKSVLLTRSSSQNQAKGYRREILYAQAISNDPRYSLHAMNAPLKRTWGNTDADIVFQHKPTGHFGRIEVKDYSFQSQENLQVKLKKQIDKMAKEAKYSGQPQFWMNRREVHPEIFRYATSKGIYVFGNVSTGQTLKGNVISSREALDSYSREINKVDRTRTAIAGAQFAFGALMLIDSMPNAWNDYQSAINSESEQTWLRFGESGSKALTGGAMTVAGGAEMTRRVAATRFQAVPELQGKFYRLGRAGGITSVVAMGLAEGFAIARYRNGDVSSKDFWTSQWVMSASASGGLIGSWTGGLASAMLVKNPISGALVGGGAGSWFGQKLGAKTAETYYDWQFAKLDEGLGKFVYQCYGIDNTNGSCLQLSQH
jgi:hypothetical protein